MRKVLKVKNSEFLLEVRNNSIATTNHIKKALDVSSFTLEQITYLLENLHKVGYVDATVVEDK